MKRKFTTRSAPNVSIARRTTALRIPRKRIDELIHFIARQERVAVEEVDIAVVEDLEMKTLNRTYHHVAGTTDVLSFNLADSGEPVCAQIIVCANEAIRQSQRFNHTPQQELLLYIAHGFLHLIGYDDTMPAKAKIMELKQKELLAIFLKMGQ